MKKTLLLFATIFAACSINAQTLTISDSDGNPIDNGATIEITQDITFFHVTNTSASTVSARAKKIEDYLASGDDIMLCWGACFPSTEFIVPPPQSDDPITIEAGVTDEGFDIIFTKGNPDETTEMTLIFYYEENPDDSSYIFINFPPESGLSNINNTNLLTNAYPNPADDFTKIDLDLGGMNNAEIVFYNVLGEEIYKQKLNRNKRTLTINTTNWTDGIYYYSLLNNNNNLTTKKLIINH